MLGALRVRRDPEGAITVYDEALGLLTGAGRVRHSVLRNRAHALAMLARHDEAEVDVRRALADASARGDQEQLGTTCLQLAELAAARSEDYHPHLDAAELAFTEVGDDEGLVLVAFARGNAALHEGRLAVARAGAERIETWAERLQHQEWRALGRQLRGWIDLAEDHPERALEGFTAVQDASSALGAAFACLLLGRSSEALAWLPPRGEGLVAHRCLRALATGLQGDLTAAEEVARTAEECAAVQLVRTGVEDADMQREARTSLFLRLITRIQSSRSELPSTSHTSK
jgi:hypothetical protein